MIGAQAIAALVGASTVSIARADTTPPATNPPTPATVSDDALPTVQINGVVWAQVVVGNTVYVTGKFSSARPAGSPAGQNETPRGNLLAYNITTGALITSFAHSLNAEGKSITATPDGTRLFVGGSFTAVDGHATYRVAEFTIATGKLDTSFNAGIDGPVYAVTASATTLYVGGAFSTAKANPRQRLAAFDVVGGGLTTWKASADGGIAALTLSPNKSVLVVGGSFQTLSGKPRYGLGAVNLTTGDATTDWTTSPVILDAGAHAGITSLRADGANIYGGGYVFGAGGNFEGRFAISQTGSVVWLEDCHGDTYDILPVGPVLYSVGHSHACQNINAFPEIAPRTFHRALAVTTDARQVVKTNTQTGYANFGGKPAPTQLDWYPDLLPGTYTGQSQAAWSITGNANYLSVGGEFPKVNNVAQQGLARFAVVGIAPNKKGPVTSSALTPVATKVGSTIRLTWGTTYDPDNAVLTYRVFRDGGATAIGSTTADTRLWTVPTPTQTFTDPSPTNGAHTYVIKVSDSFGNTASSAASNSIVITGANNAPTASYTTSCTDLACTFNAGGSSDSDGSIAGYAWNFGDGATATKVSAQHSFAAGGSYQVSLTVTDNGGATATRTTAVSVIAPNSVFATDTFNRTVPSGLGTANVGGAWSPPSSANLSVTGGVASFGLSPAVSTSAALPSTSSAYPDVSATFALGAVGGGGGTYFSAEARRIDSTRLYRGSMHVLSTGVVQILITRLDGSSTELTIASPLTLTGSTYVAGQQWKIRFSLAPSGAATALTLKAWPAASAEPASWQLTATDASIAGAGPVGLRTYLSGSAPAPLTISVTGFEAKSNV